MKIVFSESTLYIQSQTQPIEKKSTTVRSLYKIWQK